MGTLTKLLVELMRRNGRPDIVGVFHAIQDIGKAQDIHIERGRNLGRKIGAGVDHNTAAAGMASDGGFAHWQSSFIEKGGHPAWDGRHPCSCITMHSLLVESLDPRLDDAVSTILTVIDHIYKARCGIFKDIEIMAQKVGLDECLSSVIGVTSITFSRTS